MPTHYWRNFYYYMGWEYESENDKPKEEDVKKKQVLCKQVNLSKLKLNKVRIEPTIPFDLQKIETNDKKVPLPLSDELKPPKLIRQTNIIYNVPRSSPINIPEKQQNTYADKLKLLKNI